MNPNSPFSSQSSLSAESLYSTIPPEEARELSEEAEKRKIQRAEVLGRLASQTFNPIKRFALQQEIRKVQQRPALPESHLTESSPSVEVSAE